MTDDLHLDPHEVEKIRLILHEFGDAKVIKNKLDHLDELIEEREHREWLLGTITKVVRFLSMIVAGYIAFKYIVADFITFAHKPN